MIKEWHQQIVLIGGFHYQPVLDDSLLAGSWGGSLEDNTIETTRTDTIDMTQNLWIGLGLG